MEQKAEQAAAAAHEGHRTELANVQAEYTKLKVKSWADYYHQTSTNDS